MRSELGAGPTVPLASREDFYRHLDGNEKNRLTDSGEEFNYCNSGYTLLGFLVEHVTDRPFSEYVTEEVFEPLGMERSTYSPEEFEADADAMTPYFQDDEQPEPVVPGFDEFTQANGSLVSSVTDVATFLSETVTRSGQPAIPDVDGDALAEMQRPMTVMNETIDGSEVGYGYRWMSAPLVGDRIVGHGGGTAATTYAFWGLRDAGIGVVVGCNTHPG